MERKLISLAPHNSCTGCAACADACPKMCIFFKLEDLHWYPVVGEDCISCGKCMQSCPVLQGKQEKDYSFKQYYKGAYSNNPVSRRQSTSGGIGSAIAKHAIEEGYYICGAAFDENFHLRHVLGKDEATIEALRGSKYLQSDTRGIYKKINELLSTGDKVCFFGTPCQVEALQLFIGNHNADLITCAIVCHGVNSPIVWEDFADGIQRKINSKLTYYNFRSKDLGGWGKLAISMGFINGKIIKQYAYSNQFHVWFGEHYILRESCFHCAYREEQRTADITIGDFWGVEKVLPKIDTHDGISVVVCSTQKGSEFLKTISDVVFLDVDQGETPKVLKGFLNKKTEEKTQSELVDRRSFIDYYASHGYEQTCKKYPATTTLQHYWDSIKSHLHLK